MKNIGLDVARNGIPNVECRKEKQLVYSNEGPKSKKIEIEMEGKSA